MEGAIISESGGGIIPLQGGGIIPLSGAASAGISILSPLARVERPSFQRDSASHYSANARRAETALVSIALRNFRT